MELVYEGDDYNLYTVPIKLNGEDSYLSVAYDYEAKDFYILGATSGVDESGQAGKDKMCIRDRSVTTEKQLSF